MGLIESLRLYLAIVVFVIIPGPGVMAMLAISSHQGFRRGVILGLGEGTGDLVYAVAVVFSLGLVASSIEPYMLWVRLLGGGYLVYIGIRLWLAKPTINQDGKIEADREKQSGLRLYLTGLLISLTNPKVIIFYLSFFPLFVDLNAAGVWSHLLVLLLVAFGLMTGVVIISGGGGWLNQMVRDPKKAVIVNRISGVILVLVGVALGLGWPF